MEKTITIPKSELPENFKGGVVIVFLSGTPEQVKEKAKDLKEHMRSFKHVRDIRFFNSS